MQYCQRPELPDSRSGRDPAPPPTPLPLQYCPRPGLPDTRSGHVMTLPPPTPLPLQYCPRPGLPDTRSGHGDLPHAGLVAHVLRGTAGAAQVRGPGGPEGVSVSLCGSCVVSKTLKPPSPTHPPTHGVCATAWHPPPLPTPPTPCCVCYSTVYSLTALPPSP